MKTIQADQEATSFPLDLAELVIDPELSLHADDYRDHGWRRTLFYSVRYGNLTVGRVGLYGWLPDHNSAWMSYSLSEKYEGRGIATRAASRLRDASFDGFGLDEIHLFIDKKNERSKRVAARLGAQLVSTAETSERWVIRKEQDATA